MDTEAAIRELTRRFGAEAVHRAEESLSAKELPCPWCGRKFALHKAKIHVKFCLKSPRPRGETMLHRGETETERTLDMKLAEPTAEKRRVITLAQVLAAGDSGVLITLDGKVDEGSKGDFSDYYFHGETDSGEAVLGVREDSLNFTEIHEACGGDTEKLKGKSFRVTAITVKNGAYAGKQALCVTAESR